MGESILIVDDDRAMCDAVCHWAEHAGYTAVGASSAEEALEALRRIIRRTGLCPARFFWDGPMNALCTRSLHSIPTGTQSRSLPSMSPRSNTSSGTFGQGGNYEKEVRRYVSALRGEESAGEAKLPNCPPLYSHSQ